MPSSTCPSPWSTSKRRVFHIECARSSSSASSSCSIAPSSRRSTATRMLWSRRVKESRFATIWSMICTSFASSTWSARRSIMLTRTPIKIRATMTLRTIQTSRPWRTIAADLKTRGAMEAQAETGPSAAFSASRRPTVALRVSASTTRKTCHSLLAPARTRALEADREASAKTSATWPAALWTSPCTVWAAFALWTS